MNCQGRVQPAGATDGAPDRGAAPPRLASGSSCWPAGDWIPGTLIVVSTLIGLASQIRVIDKLCRQDAAFIAARQTDSADLRTDPTTRALRVPTLGIGARKAHTCAGSSRPRGCCSGRASPTAPSSRTSRCMRFGLDDGALLDAAEQLDRAHRHLFPATRSQAARLLGCEPAQARPRARQPRLARAHAREQPPGSRHRHARPSSCVDVRPRPRLRARYLGRRPAVHARRHPRTRGGRQGPGAGARGELLRRCCPPARLPTYRPPQRTTASSAPRPAQRRMEAANNNLSAISATTFAPD